MAKRELFNSKNKTNIEITARMINIVYMGRPLMKKELINQKKSTWRNLSKS